MIVILYRGPKLLSKMLRVQEIDSKFIYEQANLIVYTIKNAGGNNVTIICDEN